MDQPRVLGGHGLPAAGLLIALRAVLSLAPVIAGRLCHPGVLGVVAGVAVTLALATTIFALQAFARFLSCLARLPLDNDAFKVASATE